MHGFESTHDAASQAIVAAILIGVFALLAADRVHRVLIPIGAVALVWLISYLTPFRLISFEASKEAVDLNVILLLFAMMALVGVLKTTNVFPWAVDRLLERSRGNPSRSAALIIWFTGVLSALLDNVTTVIFAYPMAQEMARRLRINGAAFFLPMVMAANIGGTATLIGDPPNVLIGADPRTHLSFMDFIYHLTVPCTFMMVVLVWYSRRYYPADIGAAADRDHPDIAAPSGAQLINVPLLRVTCWVSALILLGFATYTFTGMPVSVPAVIGIAAILFAQDYYYLKEHRPTQEERQHGVLAILEKDVEWPTLAFFLFLFVLVGAAVETGLIDSLALALGWLIDAVSHALTLDAARHAAGRRPASCCGCPASCRPSSTTSPTPRSPSRWWRRCSAACRPARRPGPVVGAGARHVPGRQRHADWRLGQRRGHGPRREGRQAHLVQRVHRLRCAGDGDHAHHVVGLSRALALCRLDVVNIAGAVVLAALLALQYGRRHAGAR